MAKVTLDLTPNQFARIAAALHITSPSGGGSDQWSLCMEFSRQVEQQLGLDLDTLDHFESLCNVVIDEAVEAGVVERLQ